ncbi:MAG: phosphoglycerate mutase [Lysobacterales bacterium CG17_big_fil_post_rev_8_21_14_2_50_64_11]|nr:MAG: phosphoglycerate mutase [Xanthomonadales bacterium CG17_big_fil_post_rev_8_21_14_2_50_64_11]
MKHRLLLPARARLAGLTAIAGVAEWLCRADSLPVAAAGYQAQLQRQMQTLPRGWPLAAVTRQAEMGDAGDGHWLRADPAHVRADLSAVRLLACGDMGLTPDETESLLRPLKPLFGDLGWPLSAPSPERWYVSLPRDAQVPAFTDPDSALGAEIHDLLPAGNDGRRWRALLNEAQIVLHNHPLNGARARSGRPPINSLWFHGGGRLPEQVVCDVQAVLSDDFSLCAFAGRAGADTAALPERYGANAQAVLIDLRAARDPAQLANDWLLPLRGALRAGQVTRVELDFADGHRLLLTAAQRWRFWRRSKSAML